MRRPFLMFGLAAIAFLGFGSEIAHARHRWANGPGSCSHGDWDSRRGGRDFRDDRDYRWDGPPPAFSAPAPAPAAAPAPAPTYAYPPPAPPQIYVFPPQYAAPPQAPVQVIAPAPAPAAAPPATPVR